MRERHSMNERDASSELRSKAPDTPSAGSVHWLEYVKVLGALVLAAVAVGGYFSQRDHDRKAEIFQTWQFVLQGEGTKTLHDDISKLLEPFKEYPGELHLDLYKADPA